jgi:tetratricopeptide (TPR) repeat protein
MADQVFVAREGELGQLWQFLDRALGGQGQVCFVTGEAGSGKTALVTEFARRAEEKHSNLVVAIGQCDAHTGIGDPYLPFREVLCQLTGDVEGKLARGAITQENANRLRKLVVASSQILVEVAPDLIGLFVPGAHIVGELGKALADKAGWMDKLAELAKQPKPGSLGLDQSQVFEQYTNVLIALVEKQPLLLILDDLHWADDGSSGLLFRLGRRIEGSRILIVGTYRPEEVALDRAGERHPLQKVLAEFKRYFGEISVDLDEAKETEGQHFVDALLAVEPNRVSDEFRQTLFQLTRGHPLFTIEVLRDMQERGALVHDDQGHWIEGALLDWDDLPDRVEGAIEERIGRLKEEQRNILSVASVEGQAFTAQVVARAQDIHEQRLLRVLSQELEKRHRLVQEQEEVRIGHLFLSRYQFAHALFQQYLYNELGAGERRVLHGQIAMLLEELYQGHTEQIAVRLARHYTEAGQGAKAIDYLLQAGDAAARLQAHAEARLHYARALDALAHLPDTVENRQRRVDTLIKLTASSWRSDSPEESLARLAEAERLAAELPGVDGAPGGDRLRLARVHFWMGRLYRGRNAVRKALEYYQQVLPVAEQLDDPELMAITYSAIGWALSHQLYAGEANVLLGQAIPILEQMGNWPEWIRATSNHGSNTVMMGAYAAGVAEMRRALARAEEMHALREVALCSFFLSHAYWLGGDLPRSVKSARRVVEAAEESGDWLYLYLGYFFRSLAESRGGQFEAAASFMARAQAVAQESGGSLWFADYTPVINAEIALGTGRVEEALSFAERAVEISQKTGGPRLGLALRMWGQTLGALTPPQYDKAEAQFAESVHLSESGQNWLDAARTHAVWGTVCRDRGDLAAAREHWEKAAAQWEASGITWELERVRALIETLPEG